MNPVTPSNVEKKLVRRARKLGISTESLLIAAEIYRSEFVRGPQTIGDLLEVLE